MPRTVSSAKYFMNFRFEIFKSGIRQVVVGVTGVEPVTLRLSSACSNQLSYTPMKISWSEIFNWWS